MRPFSLPLTALFGLAAAQALAQPTYPPAGAYPPSAYPPPGSYPPGTYPRGTYLPGNYPPPPPVAPPVAPPMQGPTGARSGNLIGTGSSLPRADRPSNILPGGPEVAPNLPSPPVGENASPRAYLMAARNSLATGRAGEAQQSLEMAQTRLLDRSVPLFQTNVPDRNPAVEQISAALQALGAGDRGRAMQIIDATIPQVADIGTTQ
jgi:hypothetical protein